MTDTSFSDTSQNTNIIVGRRVRELREQQYYSLRALAERSGLSVNAISKIERGENSPTVASLHALAFALGVPITEFFQEHANERIVYVKQKGRLQSHRNGTGIESLGIGLRNQQIEPFVMTLEPQTGSESHTVTHAGQEFVYCLEGVVHYEINEEQYVLETGDSLLFDSEQPHRCLNLSDSPAAILLVFQSLQGTQTARQRHIDI